MNAGKPMGQLAACFVLPVEDSMRSIFDTLKNAALILQSGGGTGFSFSRLRPKADIVRSTGGIASGPVFFMNIYNTTTDIIKQGGARRGANMGILLIDHPDILEFIRVKRNVRELANFNISVAVTDAFMEALGKKSEYQLVNPRSGRITGTLRADAIAPTGTLATIADCSSGIEPLFALAYKRHVLDTELTEINGYFVEIARERGIYSEELMQKVMTRGNLRGMTGIPADIRRLFRTALEIPAADHIEMQAAFQEYTDNAVSKTVNLPARAKREDVARAFLLAYEKGVKGITVFRYGSKKGTLLKFVDTD